MRINPTHCSFAELLDEVEPTSREICTALRETIVLLHRHVVETAWRRQRMASYGVGPRKMSDHYAYIAPQSTHVRLGFYRGAFLNDPTGLLRGAGTKLRHIDVEHAALAASPQLKNLVRQAISERLAARS